MKVAMAGDKIIIYFLCGVGCFVAMINGHTCEQVGT